MSFSLCHSFFQNKFFATIPGRSVQAQKYDFQQAERYIPIFILLFCAPRYRPRPLPTGPTIQVATIVFIIYEAIDLLFCTDFINSGQAMVGPTYPSPPALLQA